MPVCCVDWKFPGDHLTVISPGGRRPALVCRFPWTEDLKNPLGGSERYSSKKDQGLKCHPILLTL